MQNKDMFSLETHDGDETSISYRIAGDGPPLLLLHGFPQTNMMWHKIAPALAERYTVVAADLRGYGDSGHPESDAAHAPYPKRAMAADMAGLMRGLGHDSFMVAGHDRGGRVAHRLARDHGDCVTRIAVLDIPHGGDVRADRHAFCHSLLPLVLPDPAGAIARTDDRC
ncbi:MAG: hypothetical protein CM15mP115_23750 [Alphaproteobacteria bacterium]|nr:MAG: hypothetical protein CM15mP115_23750 [Alphaproteobacteria bacterium]